MERRIRSRILILILLIFAFVGLFSLRVYKLQTAEDAQQPDTLTYRTTVEAARDQHAARRLTAAPAANPALDYEQREYKEEDFGDDFYFDYEKMFGKEEKP